MAESLIDFIRLNNQHESSISGTSSKDKLFVILQEFEKFLKDCNYFEMKLNKGRGVK